MPEPREEARATAPTPPERVVFDRNVLAVKAYCDRNHRDWFRFLELHVGDFPTAHALVEEVCDHLVEEAGEVLRQPNVDEYCFRVVKDHLAHWLELRGRTMVEAGTEDHCAALAEQLVRYLCQAIRIELDEDREGGLDALRELLGSLPDRVCEVVVLRHLCGLDDQRVARQLGITPETVRSHLSRARKLLDHLRKGKT